MTDRERIHAALMRLGKARKELVACGYGSPGYDGGRHAAASFEVAQALQVIEQLADALATPTGGDDR